MVDLEQRELIFRSEREASGRDAIDAEVQAEEREWEPTLCDGID